MILPGREAKRFVLEENYIAKVNPAGIDLIPKKVFTLDLKGKTILIENERRGYLIEEDYFPLTKAIKEIKPFQGYWQLEEGYYYVVFPKIKIPENVVEFAYPRSSFNRLGILKFQTAVFDPGYEGEFTQTFYFPTKAKISTKVGGFSWYFSRRKVALENMRNTGREKY